MAKKAKVKTVQQALPTIYAYVTPEIRRHDGWTKIGYTEQAPEKRIKQQTKTADVIFELKWHMNAIYEDGGSFKDQQFHAYLQKHDVERLDNTEWFHILPEPARQELIDFRINHGIDFNDETIEYKLRAEQDEAVSKAKDYFALHEKGEYLWNAKPRFGKTLASYDLCKRLDARNVLIVTNRPAIANSWYEDYCKFLGPSSGYLFISEVETLKGDDAQYKHVLSRKAYEDYVKVHPEMRCIEFVSLQNLKGSIYFNGKYRKLDEVAKTKWDILIVDEAHEGVDTYKTDVAFDHINRSYTLHLSGTPFKALANNKFEARAIYNWTYADEQNAKRKWEEENSADTSPYADLPRLNLFTYQMSDIIRDKVEQGVEINGETMEYAFDLNEFFEVDKNGRFLHEADVNRFLEALSTQEKFPFSTPELRKELKHTLWILNRVESAKALIRKLRVHDVFGDGHYEIVPAIGDGRVDEGDKAIDVFQAAKDAIKNFEKTITVSVGQLTTGVTIPEWTGVLMLSNMKSPSLYMQSAFRCQNPCLFHEKGQYFRKKNAYVFDFDPARTLIIFEEFANDLTSDTSGGKGDSETRKRHVRELLNFFPVYGEDPDGEMVELDAEKVLTIPRKLKSREVVNHGFMSNYLFQNISNVFGAPPEVLEKIKQMMPAKDPGPMGDIDENTKDDLSLNDEGEVELPDELIIGKATDIFGDKQYGSLDDAIDDMFIIDDEAGYDADGQPSLFSLDRPVVASPDFSKVSEIAKGNIDKLMNDASQHYDKQMSSSTKNSLDRKFKADAEMIARRNSDNFRIEMSKLNDEREEALNKAKSDEDIKKANEAFLQSSKKLQETSKNAVRDELDKAFEDAQKEIVRSVETDVKEKEKREKEDSVRDHLRGFSRTIPSFLMAYGDENTTLENFDKIIPPDVFKDVTGITVDDFRFLRDGGDWDDDLFEGPKKHFDGHLFDPIVFNDSVKEFLAKKKELANYFDENQKEDIFDYIPPQKTNQIFTPRRVVIDMLDRLEAENPGCFDDPDKTFADFYMKSGMYITEIVKRLYKSENMKRLFPDSRKRLEHIFEKQVFGLAPTEIIYRITLSYILGFSDDFRIEKHNIRKCDSLALMKEGRFESELKNLYGGVLTHE